MGAGSVCLQRQDKCLVVRVGPEEEGVNSLRPELAAVARTLQATSPEVDLLYLCDSETTLHKASRWIGSGPRTTLAGDANADIMKTIIECVRERVIRGARTFMVKVKAHRGEPLNEWADTQAERARQLPPMLTMDHPHIQNVLHMARQRREASVHVVENRQESNDSAGEYMEV
jgi:ribonuclease HI